MRITAQQYLSNDKDRNTYVSVFRYYNKQSEKRVDKDGDLYAIMHLSGTQDIPAERIAKFVWDGIVDGYLYSNSQSANESLKDAISEGVRKLRGLIRNDVDLEKSGVNISFTIIAQRKEGIYVGNLGENNLYVYRENKLTNLVEVLNKNKAQTAGLALKKGEVILASTPSLLNEGIANFVGHKNMSEFRKAIRDFSSNLINSEGLLVLEIGNAEREDVKEIEVEKKEIIRNPKEEIKKEEVIVEKEQVKMKEVEEKREGRFKLPEMKFVKEKVVPILGSVVRFMGNLFSKVKPLLRKAGEFFRKIYTRVWDFLQERLGKKRWFKKYSAKISQRIPRSPSRSRATGFKIDGYKERNLRGKRFRLLFTVVVIIALVVLGVNFTINAKNSREIKAKAESVFNTVDGYISSAESNMSTDRNSAETSLYQAGKKLKEIPEGLSEEDTSKLKETEDKILELEDILYKRTGVDDKSGTLMTYIDSRLSFGEDSEPTDISIYSDNLGNEYLLVTDPGSKAVYRVALYDKEVERLPDNEGLVQSPQYISMGNAGVYVYDERMGMIKASFEDEWFTTFVPLSGLDANDIKAESVEELIVLTATDNVYLLSSDKSALLKSGFSYGNSYSLGYTYIDNDAFVTGSDVLADLSVYILNGDVIRYNYSYVEQKQVESPLGITGLSGDIGSLTKGYTRGSLDYGLYLFDSSGYRLFKFEKPKNGGGEVLHPDQLLLKGQYVYRGDKENMWSDVKDIVVDGNEKFMYVLDGSTIWKVQL